MNMRETITAAKVSGPETGADGVTALEFRFGADDPLFAGHFPGRPLLPGVFQLEMARLAAEWTLKCPLTVREIAKSKFLRPILPEETVRVSLKLADKDGTITARAGFSVNGQAAGETLVVLGRNP